MNNQDLELLNVFDEENEKRIGIAERGVVHYYNLWNRGIACWILNEKMKFYCKEEAKIKNNNLIN